MDNSSIIDTDFNTLITENKSKKHYRSKLEKLGIECNSDDLVELKKIYNRCMNKEKYICYILEKTNLSRDRITKWDLERIEDKYNTIYNQEQTSNLLEKLREYGDGFSNKYTPISVLKQRLYFLRKSGIREKCDIRYDITKKISNILKKNNQRVYYKKYTTMDINELENLYKDIKKKYHRQSLIDFLVENGYSSRFLRSKKDYVLEFLKGDIKTHDIGSRGELIKLLSEKGTWSRSTLRNWDMGRLKSEYIKCMQESYSPLKQDRGGGSIIKSLEDFNNVLTYIRGV